MALELNGTTGVSAVQAGAVESGDLAAGAVGSGDLPAGSVIQVVQATSTTNTDTTATSLIDVEPSVTITPSSSNNKILVMHTAGGMVSGSSDSIKFELQRNNNTIWVSNRYGYQNIDDLWTPVPFHASYLDSPNTTSAVTYNFAMRQRQSGDLRHNNDDSNFSGLSTAITIAMEIAG